MYVSAGSLRGALQDLYGSAGHLLKIWLTLKHMGLKPDGEEVEIDTSNSTPSLKRLFGCGAADGRFYIPFAHTPRYLTMKHDAARAVVQTNIQRWASSGSVVTCDPTDFLSFANALDGGLRVTTGRRYPLGLGIGSGGFALDEDSRVAVPLAAFSIWYGRQTKIPPDVDPNEFLISEMVRELNISASERAAIFIDKVTPIELAEKALTEAQVFQVCEPFIAGKKAVSAQIFKETFSSYSRRIRSMVSDLNAPVWMRESPSEELKYLLRSGSKSLLLYGPPRTGKTRFIDEHVPRLDPDRCTIQIHDGWGYDHLIEGFKPDESGNWTWVDGPLKIALDQGKSFIVLEEINRTSISQALGEVFSLIEEAYRGPENAILLRSGKQLSFPTDTVIIMTMNTVDKSTEEIDDALMGRLAAVEFPPRPEDLNEMLAINGLLQEQIAKIANIYVAIIDAYPLGHGYFAGLKGEVTNSDVIRYYKSRIRSVLVNHFGELRQIEVDKIDNLVDENFGANAV